MPSAEIITIGTEILLGEIVDTNSRYLARRLRDLGIDLFRTTTVGDNVQRIGQAIQQSIERCDVVLTTGGLGPTVDDPTRQAVALCLGVETEFHPELWEQIQDRFRRYNRQPTENNRRQAYIPAGAIAVENPVGTAPAFIVETPKGCIISLPGVPREMEYLMEEAVIPYLREHLHLSGIIKTRVLHTAGVGESQIDHHIGDLETLANPTVGLAAHSGQVDVRIAAKADSEQRAEAMIAEIENILRQRLGRWIYGVDDETLESAALKSLEQKGWDLVVVEAGLGGELLRRFWKAQPTTFRGAEMLSGEPDPDEFPRLTGAYRALRKAAVGLGALIVPGFQKQIAHIVLIFPGKEVDKVLHFERPYGGPPENAPRWAAHHSLDILRNLELEE